MSFITRSKTNYLVLWFNETGKLFGQILSGSYEVKTKVSYCESKNYKFYVAHQSNIDEVLNYIRKTDLMIHDYQYEDEQEPDYDWDIE